MDDVEDAVAQAKFSEKRWVWIPDETSAYVRAHIINDLPDQQVSVSLESGKIKTIPASDVFAMNPPQFDRVEDMAELTQLNEPSVIHNLAVRYRANQIYTYSGLFLVAVNPYRSLPIYSMEYMQSYKGRRRGELSPHIYAVADQAYHDMLHDRENQSILITGESGAGKTENTKVAIQYLTTVASKKSGNRDNGVNNQLEQQILQANPILEAFGNAQTIRNNNSSRFGKFIRIEFNMQAQICGANIEWYLLEKSRVRSQFPNERNYHIFYQLLNADKATKDDLLLNEDSQGSHGYEKYLQATIEGVDDGVEYKSLINAMGIMGFEAHEISNFLRMVAAVMHLGNILLTPDSNGDRVDIKDTTFMDRACYLLGISSPEFKKSLLKPRIRAGRDWVNQAKSCNQVTASIDALTKTIYERNFSKLVERINQAIDYQHSSQKMGFIGVLDIAGFEIFQVNSFEQLCINYTNEKLQQFFNHNMFELEQEEYKKEKIDWSFIDFGLDLQPTIDLIEKTNPVGILSCLEEECVAPQGTDKRFLEKLNAIWVSDDPDAKYKSMRFKESFTVKHYAGQVEYSTQGWIGKNKDPLNEDITRLLARSSNKHVAILFEDYLTKDEYIGDTMPSSVSNYALCKLRKGGGSFRTVGQRHKQQLLSLMNTLYLTRPHFVRCILPNNRKQAGEIQVPLVLDQLRCNGVLEGIRICRKGFPNRLSFDDFRKRYEILCPDELKGVANSQSACQYLLKSMSLDPEKYRIGATKVFFKATVLAEFEEVRDRKLSEHMTRFQACCRRFIACYRLGRVSRQADAIKVMQKNARLYIALQKWAWWRVYAKLKPLNVAYRVETQIKEKDQKINKLEDALTEHQKTLQQMNDQYKSLKEDYQIRSDSFEKENQDLREKLQSALEQLELLGRIADEKSALVNTKQQYIEYIEKEKKEQQVLLKKSYRSNEDQSLEYDILAAEYEMLEQNQKTLQEEKETLVAEKETLISEKDHLEQQRNSLQESSSLQEMSVQELKSELEISKKSECQLKENFQNIVQQHSTQIAQLEVMKRHF
ncbi:P-loop containing nucleoside triphosphate hydrolase protein [Spinellus fusiger]|nr:P-loop containing nucleoside triphosphate hydrolase protein [Spinellus fusiger]